MGCDGVCGQISEYCTEDSVRNFSFDNIFCSSFDYCIQNLIYSPPSTVFKSSRNEYILYMASSQNDDHSETREEPYPRCLSITNSEHEKWDDVTETFNIARTSMAVGEMIHTPKFTLLASMSAIELMDPKMDVGCGFGQDVFDVCLPETLTDLQVINIMDHLLACEMTWLNSHTLPQTVFSCVYTQRLSDIPRTDLFTFIRLQLATLECVLDVILEEKVAEEEDFVSWTFGFQLPGLDCKHSDREDEAVHQMLIDAVVPSSDERFGKAIMLRLRLRAALYHVLRRFTGQYPSKSSFSAAPFLEILSSTVEAWARCPYRHDIDKKLIETVFDPTVNSHLLCSTPPCTAPILSLDATCDNLRKRVEEFRGLLALRTLALPPDKSQHGRPRYSLHVAIHALEIYCAENKPHVLSRSLMSRLMLMVPKKSLFMFDNEKADFTRMVATDMGFGTDVDVQSDLSNLGALKNGVRTILECFCRNRSRQRQQLLQALLVWDQSAFLALHPSITHGVSHELNGEGGSDTPGKTVRHGKRDLRSSGINAECKDGDRIFHESGSSSKDRNSTAQLETKSPLELVVHEISCRLLVQHFLIGFECDLYYEFEFVAVFFYVGWLLTHSINTTTSLAQCGLKGASLHPLRFALYLVDDARLTLCKGLTFALVSLSEGPQWRYTWRRDGLCERSHRDLFGSEALWYDQRFRVASGLYYGPSYVSHMTLTSTFELQTKQLLQNEPLGDITLLRLKEAAEFFLLARRKLEKARKVVGHGPPNMILDEILKLGRVAVENSLTMSQVLRQYTPSPKVATDMYAVTFTFDRHLHFPVIKVSEIKREPV